MSQRSLWPDDPPPVAEPEPEVAPPSPLARLGTEQQIDLWIVEGRLRLAAFGAWVGRCDRCGGWEVVEHIRRWGSGDWTHYQGADCLGVLAARQVGEFVPPRFVGRWAGAPAAEGLEGRKPATWEPPNDWVPPLKRNPENDGG